MWRGGGRRTPDADAGGSRAKSEPRNVAPVGRPQTKQQKNNTIPTKMKNFARALCLLIWLGTVGGQAQNDATMEPKKNPLLCDPQVGMCELPGTDNAPTQADTALAQQKAVKIVYFTDPICSSCWGIEPQLQLCDF